MSKGESSGIDRRRFVKFCMSALAASTQGAALAAPRGKLHAYPRSLLIDNARRPIRASDLVVGENYIFHYPFITTPCFLINLGTATTSDIVLTTERGKSYTWQGGVGPDASVVAFSAICAHKMTHPARAVSFINYRHERVRFRSKQKKNLEGSQVIFCCSEKSVYDARRGARVLGGPAKQPLAAVKLEYDGNGDSLHAVGVYGGDMFKKFFDKFGDRLQLEYLTSDVDRPIGEQTEVTPLDQYCKTQILC